MRKAQIYVNSILAGTLEELDQDKYRVSYQFDYQGPPISLTMPIHRKIFEFSQFPPFFEGLLPEGIQLEALLRRYKLDKKDYFSQLMQVGSDLVGAVTVKEIV